MRVLISAYACEPGRGSEPGAGWAWARAAAERHDVWLVTRSNNAPLIEEAIAAEPSLRLHPVYLDLPERWRFWKRGGRGVHLYYLIWQFLVRREAKSLHVVHRFDVAHHLTFAVDWMPAGVVGIPGLPAIWGPVGGAVKMPWNLWRWLGWRGLLTEAIRTAATGVMRRMFGDRTARRSAIVVAQNPDVARRFARHPRVIVEPNTALDVDAMRDVSWGDRRADTTKNALFVGRLIPLKGLRLAVAALAEPGLEQWQLDVCGEGPERRPALRLARRFGVAARVDFLGQLPRSEVLGRLGQADALVLPSMHDAAGWAVGEAATLGVPSVVLDVGGPPAQLAGLGRAVPARGSQTPAEIAEALRDLPSDRRPTDRWSATRLGERVDAWYRLVGASDAPRAAAS